MKADLTAPWRKTANTGNHLKDDNKDFPSILPPKWLKHIQVDLYHVMIVMIKAARVVNLFLASINLQKLHSFPS